MPQDHTTDKILLVIITLSVLFAALVTGNAQILDAFKYVIGATVYAIASRVGDVALKPPTT